MGAAIIGAVGAEMTFKEASTFVRDVQFIEYNPENHR